MLSSELEKNSPLPKVRFLDRFAKEVEGFNQLTLSTNDLQAACDARRIDLIEKPFRGLHGIAIEVRDFNYVYVNSLISSPLRTVAGFHELFHILHHIGDAKRCLSTGCVSNLSKNEFQAQCAGVLALMPLCLVINLTVEGMMGEFEIPRRLAEFRFNIFRDFNL